MPVFLVIGSPAMADTVYKCIGNHGKLIYQDAPCAKTQKQQTLHLDDSTASPSPQVPATTTSTGNVAVDSNPEPRSNAPNTPLTQLYRCTHAVDGSAYISPYGHPQPFLAPFGMLGAADLPLAQAYGAPGGAGISAPEANHGRVTSGLIANHYVWVQDRCRPLSVPEICLALRDQYEENAHKLRNAFKSDQLPLQQRDTELRAQLTNCN
ncbi:MAG TPA: DUF4124 domain-containing protein [Rhodanobacter sp.]